MIPDIYINGIDIGIREITDINFDNIELNGITPINTNNIRNIN